MESLQPDATARKPPAKWTRVLLALLRRPRLHRFEAERDPGIADHTLPSTISDLRRKGVRVDRRLVKLPGFGGGQAIVAEYSLAEDQRELAQRLIEAAHGSQTESP